MATTRLFEAARAERWRDVVRAFGDLERAGVATPKHRLLAARAWHRLGQRGPCGDLVDQLLEGRPDHVEALALRALLRAEVGDLEGARGPLLAAARAGRLVLRELQGQPTSPLAPLLGDPEFVLDLMRAASGADLDPDLRDPFALAPQPLPQEPDGAEGVVARRVAEVDAALEEVRRRQEEGDLAGALAALSRARARLDALAALDPERARERLATAQQRSAHLRPLLLGLELQRALDQGNALLRSMERSLAEGMWAAVSADHQRLSEVAAALSGRGLPGFEVAGAALAARGERLADQARRLARLEQLDLSVSGIVVPGPGQPARAIVNGAAVEVAGPVLDAAGEPIPGLRVARISPSVVVFDLDGVEVVRSLAPAGRPARAPADRPPGR